MLDSVRNKAAELAGKVGEKAASLSDALKPKLQDGQVLIESGAQAVGGAVTGFLKSFRTTSSPPILLIATRDDVARIQRQNLQRDAAARAAQHMVQLLLFLYGPFGWLLRYSGFDQVIAQPAGKLLATTFLGEKISPELIFQAMSPEEAVSKYSFGLEPPVSGEIYVRHPIISSRYIRADDYVAVVNTERLFALQQLCVALGASGFSLERIEVERTDGGNDVSGSGVIFEPHNGIPFNLSGFCAAHAGVSSRRQEFLQLSFGKPSHTEPRLTDEQQKWCEVDPEFRALFASRTQGNLLKKMIVLESNSMANFGGALGATVKVLGEEVGLRLRTELKTYRGATLHIRVDFYDKNDL